MRRLKDGLWETLEDTDEREEMRSGLPKRRLCPDGLRCGLSGSVDRT